MASKINELVDNTTIDLVAADVARRLSRMIPWEKRDTLLLTILHGAKPWSEVLTKHFKSECGVTPYDTAIAMSSYKGTQSTGEVRAVIDDRSETVLTAVANLRAPVVIVEDIIDTGTTLLAIIDLLGQYGIDAGRVIVAPMCLRKSGLKHRIELSHGIERHDAIDVPIVAGLNVAPNLFLVGHGLDHDGAHRELPYIGYLQH